MKKILVKHNTCLQYLGFQHRTGLEMINGIIEIANELRPHRSISYLSRVLTVAGHFQGQPETQKDDRGRGRRESAVPLAQIPN